jgi:hypothetical protein
MSIDVLIAEEIEEKVLMTPGQIVMMLDEMGGLRLRLAATSSTLDGATIRSRVGRAAVRDLSEKT